MFVKVKVTSKDINQGSLNSATDNPVALAAKRVVSHHITPSVGQSYTSFSVPNKSVVLTRPTQLGVRRFLRAFDKGNTVKPFEFSLQVSKKSLGSVFRKPGKKSAATVNANKKTNKLKKTAKKTSLVVNSSLH